MHRNVYKTKDIDTDFSKFARQYAVDYVTKFYGAKAVCGIMTKGKMQARNALTYAPKLLAKERGLDVKAYNEQGAALRKLLGNEINIHLSEIEEEVMSTFASDEVALEIFKIAKGLEGKITSYGQHAAGIISIMDGDIQDFIPCMMAADAEGNDKMVIQADMVVAEASLGFIKFDFLGLKNLNVITACQQMVTKNHGVTIDAYNLPLDDEKVYSDIFANKNTNFVFQFESDGMKKMLAELRPTRFEDLVLAVSVYRPGPMDFIPDIIACKNSGEESPIVKRIPILRETLAETYGFPVYQEQVMKIMTLCAGFSMGHADNVRRFMSKKKQDKLAAEEPAFIEGCVKTNGIAAEDAKWLFDQLMPFAKYGFNKSHAAAYSLVSYITAYLKLHYPAEYLCAAMLEQGDKTLQFLSDCKYYGLEVYPVSVNNSSVNYVPEKDGIRIGLSAIKGLKMDGDKIVANRPEVGYVSLIDFIKKNDDIKISATESCILSGALDDFVRNRETAVAYAKAYSELYEKKNDHLEKIAEAKAADNEKKIAEWTEKLTGLEDQIKALNPRQTFDLSDEKKRNYEALYLGMYLSGSPLDDFDVESSKYTNCDVITPDSQVFTIGIVNDFKEIKTSKGDLMCFFKLLDKDSNLTEVVVFPKKYKELDSLADGMVIEIKGNYDYKKDSDDEFQILADGIKVMTKSSKELLINTTSLSDLFTLLEMLKHCSASSGLNVSVKTVSGLRDVEYNVSEDILKDLDANSYEYIVS